MVTVDRLRRHRFDVSMLPLADWRIVRVRLMRISGSSRRASNLLAHRRVRLDVRLAALMVPPRFPPRFHSPLSMTGSEVGLAPNTAAKAFYLAVAIDAAEVSEKWCAVRLS